MHTPLISIVLPCYNSANFIIETIESVLIQTYTNWELIVIDDSSNDQTLKQISKFSHDPRIKVLKNEKNMGIAYSRNAGIDRAQGEFIAFLDSDDLWKPNKLETQVDFMLRNDHKFTYTSYEQIDEAGAFSRNIQIPDTTCYMKMLKGSDIACLTVMLHKGLLKENRFAAGFHEDYVLWLKIMEDNNIQARGVNKILASYRIRKGSTSSNKIKCARMQWNIYRRTLKLGYLQSIRYFTSYAFKNIRKHYLSISLPVSLTTLL